MLKKILTTTVLGVSALGVMAANAAVPGVYVTGQIGYANTHMKSKTTEFKTEDKQNIEMDLGNNGLAGRIAVGYQLNQNLAFELGYLKMSNSTDNNIGIPGKLWGTNTLKQSAIDLAAKGILPISDKFNVYGKLGVAYLTSDIEYKTYYKASDFHDGNLNNYFGIAKHKWAPEAAVGVSYDLTPNVSVDTSWTHIQPVGKNRPGNIDFVAVGIGYNFG